MTMRLLYTVQDVLDLDSELEFRIMAEEFKSLTPTNWNEKLSDEAKAKLRRAAKLREGGARLCEADARFLGEYDSPIVESQFDPGIYHAIRQDRSIP